MVEITAGLVKELREKTGAGMLDCKNALKEAGGDLEKAIEELRKKGMSSAAKKAGRLASEGLIHIVEGQGRFALVEVNSETDFVAKNEEFQQFVAQVASHVLQHQPADLAALLSQVEADSGKTWQEVLQEKIAKIGENLSIRRFAVLVEEPGSVLGSYTHMGSKIGALVKVKGASAKLAGEPVRGVAMHVAAVSPRYVFPEQIPDELKAKEKEIYLAQMQDSGKSSEILEKILEGKLKKFATEICLQEQIFIKDPEGKKTVSQFLKSIDSEAAVVEFVRFQVGEGLEKKQEDFAAEVAKQLKS